MGKLSELAKRDYDEEAKIIREAGGRPRLLGLGMTFGVGLIWALNLFFGEPWTRKEIGFAIIIIFVYPFINREWERHKVAKEMRHEREIRIELKLDSLLGLVNITDVIPDE